MTSSALPDLPVAATPFEYGVPTRIIFGPGSGAGVGELCRRGGYRSAFVVIDPFLATSPITDDFRAGLERAGVAFSTFADVQPNPVDTDLEAAAQAFLDGDHDVVIGIGGGSSLDTAKGVAILATNGGRIRDFDGNEKVPTAATACICVPTTAGTGSEVTGNISVTNSDTEAKMAIRSGHAYPRYAVLDSTLLASLPRSVAASAGMDALVHAVESYTSTRATPLSRLIAFDATRRIVQWLPRFVEDRADQAAASEMLYASCLAGMNLTNTGTGAAHAIARALGGHYGIVHGLACGVLIVPVMQFNAEVAASSYAALAGAFGLTSTDPDPTDELGLAKAVIDRVAELRARIGLPATLPITVEPVKTPAIASWAAANFGPNPRRGTPGDVIHILAQVA
jgi:alcohol dehydrogenase class IV